MMESISINWSRR